MVLGMSSESRSPLSQSQVIWSLAMRRPVSSSTTRSFSSCMPSRYSSAARRVVETARQPHGHEAAGVALEAAADGAAGDGGPAAGKRLLSGRDCQAREGGREGTHGNFGWRVWMPRSEQYFSILLSRYALRPKPPTTKTICRPALWLVLPRWGEGAGSAVAHLGFSMAGPHD